MSIDENTKLIRVFVYLARNFDARKWQESWAARRIPGINERLPYGYFRAADDGCAVFYSKDKKVNWLERLFLSWIFFTIRIDVIHAWRNRKGIYDSDVVWTHTEIQYLAVLILFRILFWKRRPKLIAQSVWLFDRWPGFSLTRRWLLSRLIAKADILTVLSPENLKVARAVFPNVRSELVLFGINVDEFAPLKKEKVHHPVHILAMGNDPHRDWPVLIRAVKDLPNCHLKIASRKLAEKEISSCRNIEILNISSNPQLFDEFDWADIVVVALKPNLHASGITVLQEAALRGVTIVCSDTGGLQAYFSDEEVYFVPASDPSEIQKAIVKLSGDDNMRWALAERAQARMKTGGLNSRSYARRHAEISKELLARESGARPAAKTGWPAA